MHAVLDTQKMDQEKKERLLQILKLVIRIGIGLLFIVSAIFKLLSLDQFELYIYSFNLMSLTLCGLAARAVIACEILLGILLIIKVKYKAAWWLTMLMLIGFSLLLIYVILFRDDTNCHCMGEIVKLKPTASLIKNLIVIVLLLFVRNEDDYQFRGKKLALAGAIIAAIVPPFVLFPIDDVYTLFSKNELDYNETSFNALMADSIMQDISFDDGNYLVGIVSTGCPYCKTSCLKVSEIASHNQLDTNRIVYLVWGDSTALASYQKETKTESFRYHFIPALQAVRISNGHFPTYLYIKDGDVVKTADLRLLTEKTIIEHLN